jgi:hypothetical protein
MGMLVLHAPALFGKAMIKVGWIKRFEGHGGEEFQFLEWCLGDVISECEVIKDLQASIS